MLYLHPSLLFLRKKCIVSRLKSRLWNRLAMKLIFHNLPLIILTLHTIMLWLAFCYRFLSILVSHVKLKWWGHCHIVLSFLRNSTLSFSLNSKHSLRLTAFQVLVLIALKFILIVFRLSKVIFLILRLITLSERIVTCVIAITDQCYLFASILIVVIQILVSFMSISSYCWLLFQFDHLLFIELFKYQFALASLIATRRLWSLIFWGSTSILLSRKSNPTFFVKLCPP